MSTRLLHSGFVQAARERPDRPALDVDGATLSYADLSERSWRIAARLRNGTPAGEAQTTAVFAERSVTAFAGILGALFAGRAYVPLNPAFPIARTITMLRHAACRSIVVDAIAGPQVEQLLAAVEEPLLVVLPHVHDTRGLAARWPLHSFAGSSDLETAASCEESGSPGDLAYLLFTSGSTGAPKGVMVTHANAVHFAQTMAERYAIAADDRFSQTFDTTFDLSVFDMFVAWERGACVCCPSRKALLNPDRFIRGKALTVWFSVPSLGLLMDRLGVLQPGRYPSLRWSLFCGERLPVALAERWSDAAPHAAVENLYGPTELTVACSAYRWQRSEASPGGTVPIGDPLPGMQARVVDEGLRDVEPGAVGELAMGGPQLTPGYWRNETATSRAYVQLPDGLRVYRTGDRVRKPASDGEPLMFVGRADHQVKVRGYRVELGEVESTLLQAPGVESAVALGWPVTDAGAAGIAAFVTGAGVDLSIVRNVAQSKLQAHAVPHVIRLLPGLPRNANGKVDRHVLQQFLDA